jgi:hypothetical protein
MSLESQCRLRAATSRCIGENNLKISLLDWRHDTVAIGVMIPMWHAGIFVLRKVPRRFLPIAKIICMAHLR